MKESLSIKLFHSLKRGKDMLGKEALSLVRGFVDSQRMSDESFMDKSGKSDLYYTAFGWMLSYVLGMRPAPEKTALYLEKQAVQTMDLIHYAAYMRCRMIRRLFEGGKIGLLLNSFSKVGIRPLSDINGIPHNDRESPYAQFIRLSLLEDTRNAIRDKNAILQTLAGYAAAGGGFSNRKNSGTATTNATAAALSVIGQLEGYKENEHLSYLLGIQREHGGFGASEDSPLPDVLSTATALFVLDCYKKQPRITPAGFIDAHWLDDGGFSATIADGSSDVEYTFYGLLALGTL